MLEVVRVQVAVGKRGVRQDVIVEFDDLELDALLCEEGLRRFEDLGVGRGRGADLERGALLPRAGGEGKGERRGAKHCEDAFTMFHNHTCSFVNRMDVSQGRARAFARA